MTPTSSSGSGPIFTNLLLADEINRAPPKTQAALLEAMQERQVTVDGDDPCARAPVPRPRHAEPDRVRGHLSAARGAARPVPAQDRVRLSERRTTSGRCSPGGSPAAWTRSSSEPVVDRTTLLAMQAAVEDVHVGVDVGRYVVELVRGTRESASVAVGSSPRGSLALLKLSRCRAALAGRDFVTPDDVKAVAQPGARSPARAQAGALGAAAHRCGRGAGGARLGADASGRRCRAYRDPARDAAAHRIRRPRRRSGSSRRSPLRRAELVVVADAVRPRRWRWALTRSASRAPGSASGSTPTGSLEGDVPCPPPWTSPRSGPIDRLELALVVPRGLEVEGDQLPRRAPPGTGRRARGRS